MSEQSKALERQAGSRASKKMIIGWLVSLLVPVIILLIPATESFTQPIKVTIAICVCCMCMFGFELMHNTVVAFLMPMLFIVAGVGTPETAFSGFTNPNTWAAPAAMLLIGCLDNTKLLKKFSYWCMIKTGGRYKGIIVGISIAAFVLSTVLSSNIGIPFIVIAYALCVALDIKPGSNVAAAIMLGTYLATNGPIYYFYNSVTSMAVGMAQAVDPDFTVTYTSYLIQNWPMIIYGFFTVFMAIVLLKKDVEVTAIDTLKKEYQSIGKAGRPEAKMLIILVLLLVGFLTSGIHKVNIAWLILAAAIVCFLPGIGIGNEKSVMAIRWNAVFFMAVCLGIGTVFSAVGANQFISELILPLLMKASKQMALFLIWLLGALVNMLLTPWRLRLPWLALWLRSGLRSAFPPKLWSLCSSRA